MQIKNIKKLYYSIGDVSEMTDLKQYVLRYWETEFTILSPAKNRAGNRTYKDEDIKIIRHIKDVYYSKILLVLALPMDNNKKTDGLPLNLTIFYKRFFFSKIS